MATRLRPITKPAVTTAVMNAATHRRLPTLRTSPTTAAPTTPAATTPAKTCVTTRCDCSHHAIHDQNDAADAHGIIEKRRRTTAAAEKWNALGTASKKKVYVNDGVLHYEDGAYENLLVRKSIGSTGVPKAAMAASAKATTE